MKSQRRVLLQQGPSIRFDLMSLVHLLLFVGLVTAAASSPGSRVILREIADQKDKAIELNTTNFDSVLKDTPAKYAVVEFFAHWSVLLFPKPQTIKIGLLRI